MYWSIIQWVRVRCEFCGRKEHLGSELIQKMIIMSNWVQMQGRVFIELSVYFANQCKNVGQIYQSCGLEVNVRSWGQIRYILIMIRFYLRRYFSGTKHELHPYLEANLRRKGMLPLKTFQSQAYQTIKRAHNFFLNSCTGSGKTLSYLFPIINGILHKKDEPTDEKRPRGAIILTLNKQLVNQVHANISQLDVQHRLKVSKTLSLSQMTNQNSTNPDEPKNIDILISTPQALMNHLTIFKGKRNMLDPEYMAVDEADLLLEIDRNVMIQFIRKGSSQSSMIKYMLAASSFPKRYRGSEARKKLQQNFKTLEFIEGQNKHRLPEKLELFYIQMKQEQEQLLKIQKLSYLRRILKDRKTQRIIIFCKQKSSMRQIESIIKGQFNTQPSFYSAQLRYDERAQQLQKFNNDTSRILISSELGSRGLDFTIPVDCIVEFTMAQNITNFINRAGRTARNGQYGQVITFVEKKNKQFFDHLRNLKQHGDEFDELFSRKRSYSKLYKNDQNN